MDLHEKRLEKIEKKLHNIDERTQKIEQKIYNGLTDASTRMAAWIDTEAPKLMSRDEWERMENIKQQQIHDRNAELGKNRDREVRKTIAWVGGGFMLINTLLAWILSSL